MKKNILSLIIIPLAFISCDMAYKKNLSEMKQVFQQHIIQKDIENNTQTTVEYVKVLSYTEIPVVERKKEDDIYLAKIHLESRWVYLNSSLVHNVNDTLDVYYNKDLKILRVEEKK